MRSTVGSPVVSFEFEFPTGLNSSLLPVFSGRIAVTSDSGEQLSVPYVGKKLRWISLTSAEYFRTLMWLHLGLAGDLKSELATLFEAPYPWSNSGTPAQGIQTKSK